MKLGALLWPEYTDFDALRDAGALADRLGFDSLWTWDHLYPIVGAPTGPIFEGYLTLAAWAENTERIRLGLMVGANTFRNPALVVKMVMTLDHMSSGRMILGIGGAWFETEHAALGFDFGSGFGERLDRLDEAVELIRAMLPGGPATARGPVYSARGALNNPPPVQEHLPILIGGSGERKPLATVARYAEAWNTGGSAERVRHKDEVLRRWCDEVGRDESEIERTLQGGTVVIRNTEAEARKVTDSWAARYGFPSWHGPNDILGPPELVAERFAPYLDLGFEHIYVDFPAPYDRESLERLVSEVKPMLERR